MESKVQKRIDEAIKNNKEKIIACKEKLQEIKMNSPFRKSLDKFEMSLCGSVIYTALQVVILVYKGLLESTSWFAIFPSIVIGCGIFGALSIVEHIGTKEDKNSFLEFEGEKTDQELLGEQITCEIVKTILRNRNLALKKATKKISKKSNGPRLKLTEKGYDQLAMRAKEDIHLLDQLSMKQAIEKVREKNENINGDVNATAMAIDTFCITAVPLGVPFAIATGTGMYFITRNIIDTYNDEQLKLRRDTCDNFSVGLFGEGHNALTGKSLKQEVDRVSDNLGRKIVELECAKRIESQSSSSQFEELFDSGDDSYSNVDKNIVKVKALK